MSLTSKINLFYLSIDKNKCTECGVCVNICPTFSISKESLAKGKPLMTCTRCGACVDACPQGAIHFATRGVPFHSGNHPMLEGREKIGFWRKFAADVWDPGIVFTFGILSLATMIASGYLIDSISRLMDFFLGV